MPTSNGKNLELKCLAVTPSGLSRRILIDYNDKEKFRFQVRYKNSAENPILQAVPSVAIFPPNNALQLNKSVPADPPYICSQKETHQLLQLHLYDLPLEVVQEFPLPLKLWHELSWPTPDTPARYSRGFSVDGPNSNPLLKAIPQIPLFPANNALGLRKEVPADSSYLCSMEETHQLLQMHITDLTAETIRPFPLPLKVHTAMVWPKQGGQHRHLLQYSVDGPDETLIPACSSDLRHLRTKIVYAAIYSSLRHMCAWYAEDLNKEACSIHTLFQAFQENRQLFALPLIAATSTKVPTGETLRLPVDRYLETATSNADNSCVAVNKIRAAILEAQVTQLSC